MAVTVSGLFLPTWLDVLDTTQLALDLDLETHKVALFNNTITPNFSTDTAYGVGTYATNEITGTGYTAGGATLTTTTVTESPAGTLMWDAADVAWAGSTLTGVRHLHHRPDSVGPAWRSPRWTGSPPGSVRQSRS